MSDGVLIMIYIGGMGAFDDKGFWRMAIWPYYLGKALGEITVEYASAIRKRAP